MDRKETWNKRKHIIIQKRKKYNKRRRNMEGKK